MKQTAVEWLVEQLNIKYGNNDFIVTHINEIEKAKEMEKQQIINSSAIAYEDMFGASGTAYGEDYYNKIFKKD